MEMVKSKEGCIDCGEEFLRPKQRGRPPVRCENCRISYKDDSTPVEVDEEKLYRGPKEALKGDRKVLPQGKREAQCPICWRIFSSDVSCEGHKDYRTTNICIDPTTIGYIAVEKHGRPVWKKPMDAETRERLYGNK